MKVMTTQDAALDYASRGWAVMPLKARKKDPHFDLIQGAYKGATTNPELINFWFSVDPRANLGISCIASGLVVIDVDFRNGGDISDLDIPATYTVKTGDGFHYYFTADKTETFKATLRPGVDVKWRGYVATAPSIHPNGLRYEVVDSRDPIALPTQIRELI